MAIPIKKELVCFPLDTILEKKIELLEAECGLIGFAILFKIFQEIYNEKNYINIIWDEDKKLLFAKKIHSDLSTVNLVIRIAIRRDIFYRTSYEEKGYLLLKK